MQHEVDTRRDAGARQALAVLDDTTVAKRYPTLRLQVFLGIFIGYAGYYLVRNNVPLVATILRDEEGFTTLGLGLLMSTPA